MIHVVIVEDELLIRLGTKLCLEGYKNLIKVDATFETAEEAEEYFHTKTADILISDIRLSGMNGLELIQNLKADHLHMGTIILSCYEDFSYARQAMDIGVDKYLLKHELTGNDLPQSVAELFESGKGIHNETERQSLYFIGEKQSEKFAEYRLGYLVLRGKGEAYNSGSDQVDFQVLSEIIQKFIKVGELGECFLRHETEVFVIFQRTEEMEKEVFEKKIHYFYERLNRNLMNYFNKNTYFFLTDSFNELGQVKTAFSEAKEWSTVSFYFENSCFWEVEQLKKRQKETGHMAFQKERIFQKEWYDDNRKEIERFFSHAEKNIADVKEVKAEAVKYFYKLESLISDNSKKNLIFRDYHSIDAIHSALRLKESLLDLIDQFRKETSIHNNQLEKIEHYIVRYYAEDLSLEKMSAQFHMSMAYFCQYFKKKKGISFVTYVNEIRIEKSKELLRNPDLSTEKVAEYVGIKNSNYFIRLFKKITGQTVGEFRRSLKVEKD